MSWSIMIAIPMNSFHTMNSYLQLLHGYHPDMKAIIFIRLVDTLPASWVFAHPTRVTLMPPDLHITGYEKIEGYEVCITNHRWLIDERIDESVQARGLWYVSGTERRYRPAGKTHLERRKRALYKVYTRRHPGQTQRADFFFFKNCMSTPNKKGGCVD